MYYSKDNAVTFIVGGRTYNTWNSWRLIPTSRPSISLPDVRTKYVDIPGMNGKLDISEILTGSILYDNIKGSFDFYYSRFENEHGIVLSWPEELEAIVAALHGKTGTLYIDQNPEDKYSGRFLVKKWTTDKAYSKVTIDYECSPIVTEDNTSPQVNEEEEYTVSSPLWNSIAIPFSSSTATQPISSGEFVFWKTHIYRAKKNIQLGETLSTDNLSYVGSGGLNSLLSDISSLSTRVNSNSNSISQNRSQIESLESSFNDESSRVSSIISQLRSEFDSCENELQTVNAELQTVNDELQTFNDELQTVNDELQINNGKIDSNTSQINSIISSLYGLGTELRTSISNTDSKFNTFMNQMGLEYYDGIIYVNTDQ